MFRCDSSSVTLEVKRRISPEVLGEGLLMQKKGKIRKQNNLLPQRGKIIILDFCSKALHPKQEKERKKKKPHKKKVKKKNKN